MPRTGLDICNEMINGWRAEARPVARVIVTSTGEDPPPWFLVVDTGNIREQFIADTIAMLFGSQADGAPHEWKRGGEQTIAGAP